MHDTTEHDQRRDRRTVERLTTGSRLWWMWVGAGGFYAVVTIVQLIVHGSTG